MVKETPCRAEIKVVPASGLKQLILLLVPESTLRDKNIQASNPFSTDHPKGSRCGQFGVHRERIQATVPTNRHIGNRIDRKEHGFDEVLHVEAKWLGGTEGVLTSERRSKSRLRPKLCSKPVRGDYGISTSPGNFINTWDHAKARHV